MLEEARGTRSSLRPAATPAVAVVAQQQQPFARSEAANDRFFFLFLSSGARVATSKGDRALSHRPRLSSNNNLHSNLGSTAPVSGITKSS